MAKAKIRLAMWNSRGAVASISDGDMDDVDIVLQKVNRDPTKICTEAANRLRKLADDFDRLATMDDPFKEKTQREAAKVASR